ncbi:uncharacterized protein [Dendropsophus ebraccatus]|uniref:uncharacterized protein n=1 Tax=Dendropsophus ebraccatus TaxID=150705 RepID=UPI003831C649
MKDEILSELMSMSVDSVLSRVAMKPQDELFRKVIGCGHQCPFCKVPCEAGGADHKDHFASFHRSRGLGQYRWLKDEKLVLDICSTGVVSDARFQNSDTDGKWHPYKEYRTYYPDWSIQPDPSIQSSDYWKYIFAQFNEKFAEEYKAKPADLPDDWQVVRDAVGISISLAARCGKARSRVRGQASNSFREDNVVNIEMPIFSFVRLGPNKLSKSKVLNQVLNPAQQHHDFFIHDNMEGGNIERKISDGLVEMSWYFPCGKSDVFSEPIAVANLRGDLETNWEQFTFLTRISSAIFIFIESMCERQLRLLSSCNPNDTKFYFIVTPEVKEKDECWNRARQFCEECLKPAITEYTFKHLGEKMVDDILSGVDNRMFSSRTFFQCNLLTVLLEEMSFKKYVQYIHSYESYSKKWILNYITEKYQFTELLETLYENILSSICVKTLNVLQDETCLQSKNVSLFLRNVCKELSRELVISELKVKVITFHNTAKVEQFSSKIQDLLGEMKDEILSELMSMSVDSVLSRVAMKPQDELFRKVIGCGHQCPFCKVPCEAGGADHKDHFASVHRPQGIGRYRWNEVDVLVTDICTTAVVSATCFKNSATDGKWHPYKEYRTLYPDWAIQPDPSIQSSDYWKYIFAKFNEKFAEKYKAKPADLPDDWYQITKLQALESLQKVFNVH